MGIPAGVGPGYPHTQECPCKLRSCAIRLSAGGIDAELSRGHANPDSSVLGPHDKPG